MGLQTVAAERCGVTQPRMNDLLRGRVSRFFSGCSGEYGYEAEPAGVGWIWTLLLYVGVVGLRKAVALCAMPIISESRYGVNRLMYGVTQANGREGVTPRQA